MGRVGFSSCLHSARFLIIRYVKLMISIVTIIYGLTQTESVSVISFLHAQVRLLIVLHSLAREPTQSYLIMLCVLEMRVDFWTADTWKPITVFMLRMLV